MAAHEAHFLKIDESIPDPYGKGVWMPVIDGATPFKTSLDAQRVKILVKDASGVIEGADGFFYVMKVWSAADLLKPAG